MCRPRLPLCELCIVLALVLGLPLLADAVDLALHWTQRQYAGQTLQDIRRQMAQPGSRQTLPFETPE